MAERKKLIEVALPLEAINREAAREKSIRHGHPSTLHLWWARRPLAACRAVLFSSLVDDPSSRPDRFPTEEAQEKERQRLFALIEELVKWENSNDERILDAAKREIRKSCIPPVPPDADDIETIFEEALKFNGYEEFGSVEAVQELGNRGYENFRQTGQWRGTLRELRGCLFFEQRSSHFCGYLPEGERLRAIRELYQTIRNQWYEAGPEIPPVLDPFAGGGSIPLEAQRLGLRVYASDLNPIAVLINKATLEIPSHFAGRPPVNPESSRGLGHTGEWSRCTGLANDVQYYGKWILRQAEKRIGHLYPKVEVPEHLGGGEATVIAWLWARTVACPNPACKGHMPLIGTYWLSTKPKNKAWLVPQSDLAAKTVGYRVEMGEPDAAVEKFAASGTGFVNDKGKKVKATFRCAICGDGVVKGVYIDAEADAGRMGTMPLAVVADGAKGRIYLPFDPETAQLFTSLETDNLGIELPSEPTRGTFASNAQGRVYGFRVFSDYFTKRQLTALATFSELIGEVRDVVRERALEVGLEDDSVALRDGGTGATAYAEAVSVYLAFALDKAADYWSSLCSWHSSGQKMRNTFSRQAISMVWDYAECNCFSSSTGNWMACVDWVWKALDALPCGAAGLVAQQDAAAALISQHTNMVSTDPPYYGNISYSDLSDFLYVWLRRNLASVYPQLFGTLLTPKNEELIAAPHRFDGNHDAADAHFVSGLQRMFGLVREKAAADFPVTVYYAFKQTEQDEGSDGTAAVASTGWESMLEGLLESGFQITGTWPMRTELANRTVGLGANALASSVVLVCRPRLFDAPVMTRRDFISQMRRELPAALLELQRGNIAPVDLAQAAIGPGMGVFSRNSAVLESDGSRMTIRTALQLINQELDSYLAEQEGSLDSDTRFCVSWFEQHGMAEGLFGEADVLARAKNTSVDGLSQAGVLDARSGRARLLTRDEYPLNWTPTSDKRLTVWECTQHLALALEQGGEDAVARIAREMGAEISESARALAYRLYAICERKGWSQEAIAYNSLIVSWGDVQSRPVIDEIRNPEQGLLEF